ncbi:protein of unknown function [Chryseobacterium sp. JV274]|nr:protein of unknown function [Chryseobacterium sp. JV274]
MGVLGKQFTVSSLLPQEIIVKLLKINILKMDKIEKVFFISI